MLWTSYENKTKTNKLLSFLVSSTFIYNTQEVCNFGFAVLLSESITEKPMFQTYLALNYRSIEVRTTISGTLRNELLSYIGVCLLL